MVPKAAERLSSTKIKTWLLSAARGREPATFDKAVLVLWALLKPN